MKAIQWFAGFFEDQGGSASSKRATLYVCLFFLYLLIRGSLNAKVIDFNVLAVVGVLILFCVGAITSEMVGKIVQKTTEEKVTEKKTEQTQT